MNPNGRKFRCPGLVLNDIIRTLLKKTLPLFESDYLDMLQWLIKVENLSSWNPVGAVLSAVENHLADNEMSLTLRSSLEDCLQKLRERNWEGETRRVANKVQSLLGGERVNIEAGEAWSDAAIEEMAKWKTNQANAWNTLLIHCQKGGNGKYTSKWRIEAEPMLKAIGFVKFKDLMLTLFPLVDKPRTLPYTLQSQYAPDQTNLILEPHIELLRGFVWCCGFQEDAELARAVMRLTLSSYRKIPQKGPRLVSAGNACVTALGMMPGKTPIGQLAVLKVKVKFGTAQKEIEKAFNAAAEREGLPRDEIEELAVPAYGLTEVGQLDETFGEYTASVRVDGASAAISWSKAGKPIKSLPAAVKAEHGEEAKELQTALKDLNTMLPAQRRRAHRYALPAAKIVAARHLARTLPRSSAGRHDRPAADLDVHRGQGCARRRLARRRTPRPRRQAV